jgi:hypothetical protein
MIPEIVEGLACNYTETCFGNVKVEEYGECFVH